MYALYIANAISACPVNNSDVGDVTAFLANSPTLGRAIQTVDPTFMDFDQFTFSLEQFFENVTLSWRFGQLDGYVLIYFPATRICPKITRSSAITPCRFSRSRLRQPELRPSSNPSARFQLQSSCSLHLVWCCDWPDNPLSYIQPVCHLQQRSNTHRQSFNNSADDKRQSL